MAPEVGLEPTTDRLTADCSTTELNWHFFAGFALEELRPLVFCVALPLCETSRCFDLNGLC